MRPAFKGLTWWIVWFILIRQCNVFVFSLISWHWNIPCCWEWLSSKTRTFAFHVVNTEWYGSWYLGTKRSQGISSHGIDLVFPEYSGLRSVDEDDRPLHNICLQAFYWPETWIYLWISKGPIWVNIGCHWCHQTSSNMSHSINQPQWVNMIPYLPQFHKYYGSVSGNEIKLLVHDKILTAQLNLFKWNGMADELFGKRN